MLCIADDVEPRVVIDGFGPLSKGRAKLTILSCDVAPLLSDAELRDVLERYGDVEMSDAAGGRAAVLFHRVDELCVAYSRLHGHPVPGARPGPPPPPFTRPPPTLMLTLA
eukprot:gene11167-14646_t